MKLLTSSITNVQNNKEITQKTTVYNSDSIYSTSFITMPNGRIKLLMNHPLDYSYLMILGLYETIQIGYGLKRLPGHSNEQNRQNYFELMCRYMEAGMSRHNIEVRAMNLK